MDTLYAIIKIIFADLLLSGDNAVVIAMACRNLPPKQMKRGILFGAGAAIVLRVVFVFVVDLLFQVKGLKLVGAALLLWIAYKLVTQKDEDEADIKSGHSLWAAVRIIVIADLVMSLDNVVAITAAATDPTTGEVSRGLVIFGLLLSMPLILFASTLIMRLIKRFPALIAVGGVLLGWIAGEIALKDALLAEYVAPYESWLGVTARLVGAAAILAVYLWMVRFRDTTPMSGDSPAQEPPPNDGLSDGPPTEPASLPEEERSASGR